MMNGTIMDLHSKPYQDYPLQYHFPTDLSEYIHNRSEISGVFKLLRLYRRP